MLFCNNIYIGNNKYNNKGNVEFKNIGITKGIKSE